MSFEESRTSRHHRQASCPNGKPACKMIARPKPLCASYMQVTTNYGPSYLHRPDLALLVYGFVPPRDPPIMSSVSVPRPVGTESASVEGFMPRAPQAVAGAS